MLYFRIMFFMISLVWTSPLFAQNFRCDQTSIHCLIADKSLTAGDRVGFFDPDNNLVAVGKVTGIVGKDGHREVEITEVFSRITQSSIPKRLKDGDNASHPLARRLFPKSLGLAAAAARLQVLDGLDGQEYNLFLAGRLSSGFSVVLRSIYAVVSGTVVKSDWYATSEQDTVIQGLGLASGVSYEALPNRLVSFRGEFGLGVMAVDASIGENISVEEVGLGNSIRNGANMLVRASGSALLNVTPDWHLELSLTDNFIFQSHLTSLGLGIVKDL